MKFLTPVHIKPNAQKIHFEDKMICVGSCFADEVGERLEKSGFDCLSNPAGVLFSPNAIAQLFEDVLTDEISQRKRVKKEGNWVHFDYHSKIHADTEEALNAKIRLMQHQLKTKLSTANWLIITFGIGWDWYHKELNTTVANCHKQPQQLFSRILLSANEVAARYEAFMRQIRTINPTVKFIFTVSPVRHTRLGMEENTLGKAVLHQVIHSLKSAQENVFYFPSYEIQLDELRDYRWYKEDMIHPNEQAVNYIFDKFSETFFESDTIEFIQLQTKLNRLLQHESLGGINEQIQLQINALKQEIAKKKSSQKC